MDELGRFRQALGAWALDGAEAAEAAAAARVAAGGVGAVVLVEGSSDRVAVEGLATRRGRDLGAERVVVVPMGGATNIGRFLDVCGPSGLGLRLAGLLDVGEERHFLHHLERVGMGRGLAHADLESLDFQVCCADLEDELIRALGAEGVQEVIEAQGELRSFLTFQGQPAQRGRPVEHQLRRFMGTHSGRKARYARALVARLDLDRLPGPLDRLLAHL